MQLSELPAMRARQGLSVAELAQCAGVSPLTVRRLEAGQPARITTALKLARAFGVGWRELVADHPPLIRERRLRLRG
jgi:transcriptional regulator with XRE-family HTH domain